MGQSYHVLNGAKINKALYGIEMLQKLSEFFITFNLHIAQTGNHACNMRLFESTGLGCCLLTDYKPDIEDLFLVDEEVVTFKTADEALEKANYLLEHPKEAQKIGQAGQRRTIKDHTAEKQVKKLVNLLNSLWEK